MMQNRKRILSLVLVLALMLSLFPATGMGKAYAQDAKAVKVGVRIESFDRNIIPYTEMEVDNFDLDEYGYGEVKAEDGPVVLHAVVKAIESVGKDAKDKKVLDAGKGDFITTIDGVSMGSAGTGMDGWMYYVNDEMPPVGINEYSLKDNDRITVVFVENYNAAYTWFDKTYVKSGTGDEIALTLNGLSYDMDEQKMKTSPISDASILVNGKELVLDGKKVRTDKDGKVVFKLDELGEYDISAQKFDEDGKVRIISRPYCKVQIEGSSKGPVPVKKHVSLDKTLNKTKAYYKNNKTELSSWWDMVAVYSSGEDIKKAPWKLPEWKSEDLKSDAVAGSYAGYILGLMAKGEDPYNVWSRDLVGELVKKQKDNGAFDKISGHIWAMIALDAAGADYDKAGAIDYLIKQQKNDGGYAWGEDNTPEASGDPDMTGMALVALSNHRDVKGVDGTIKKALDYLKETQLPTGGFASWGNDNANSVATVISGLVAVGEDVLSDAWIKDSNTMLDALARFMLDDGAFSYVLDPKKSNGMATSQAFIALNDLKNGKTVWNSLGITKSVPKGDKDLDKDQDKVEDKKTEKVNKDINTDANQKDKTGTKSPKTGDKGIYLYMLLAVMSAGILMYLIYGKKRKMSTR